jgi:hypothetical protein
VERVLPEESGKVFASGKWTSFCLRKVERFLPQESGGRFATCPERVGAGF